MDGKLKIAIIGLSSLESYAFKNLIHEEHEAHVENYVFLPDNKTFLENCVILIVSESEFLKNLSFFMPRNQQTLIFFKGEKEGRIENEGLHLLYEKDDISEIKEEIDKLIRNSTENPPMGQLSQREKDVLKQIALGKLNKEIADILCISVNTVITHRKNISIKLGIKSASGLGRYAMMNGLI